MPAAPLPVGASGPSTTSGTCGWPPSTDPSEHPVQRQFLADTSPEQWAAFLPPDDVRELTVRRVTQVITAARDCVFVEVEYFRRGLYADGPEWAPAVATIVPHDGQVDPARNPTPWWFIEWATYPVVEPTDPCA